MVEPLTLEQRGEIAYHIASKKPREDMERKYCLPPLGIDFISNRYWNRWHELLDIRSNRDLISEEEEEYDHMQKVVAKLDEREAKIARKTLNPLIRKHQNVIDSFNRLTGGD